MPRSRIKLTPTALTIFAYQVGFGDCFLLRFTYPDRPRHVLIDFGTTGLPEDAARNWMLQEPTTLPRSAAANSTPSSQHIVMPTTLVDSLPVRTERARVTSSLS